MHALLGNPHPVEVVDGNRRSVPLPPGEMETVTRVQTPEEVGVGEAFDLIRHADGIWQAHSDAPAPTWVSSDSDALAALLAENYGCEVRPFETSVADDTADDAVDTDTDAQEA